MENNGPPQKSLDFALIKQIATISNQGKAGKNRSQGARHIYTAKAKRTRYQEPGTFNAIVVSSFAIQPNTAVRPTFV